MNVPQTRTRTETYTVQVPYTEASSAELHRECSPSQRNSHGNLHGPGSCSRRLAKNRTPSWCLRQRSSNGNLQRFALPVPADSSKNRTPSWCLRQRSRTETYSVQCSCSTRAAATRYRLPSSVARTETYNVRVAVPATREESYTVMVPETAQPHGNLLRECSCSARAAVTRSKFRSNASRTETYTVQRSCSASSSSYTVQVPEQRYSHGNLQGERSCSAAAAVHRTGSRAA